VAAVETAHGKWIRPLKPILLSTYPLVLLIAALFLLMAGKMEHYGWVRAEAQGLWFDQTFFLVRNVGVLLVVFLLARKFASESLRESEKKTTWAVLYLFAFVVSQSMVAFDWVMPLEYPWINTLMGGFFFVEALYTGIALAGLLLFVIYRSTSAQAFEPYRKVSRDVATMMFGFSMLWAGLFYAQYLVTWYGNIPEEASFLLYRLAHAPWRQLCFAVIPMMFAIPFLTLISRQNKYNPYVVLAVSLVVLGGVFVERCVMLGPRINIQPWVLIVEFAAMAALFYFVFIVRNRPLETSSDSIHIH
jgi:hypothetical protein